VLYLHIALLLLLMTVASSKRAALCSLVHCMLCVSVALVPLVYDVIVMLPCVVSSGLAQSRVTRAEPLGGLQGTHRVS
jgi:hypothetical protein